MAAVDKINISVAIGVVIKKDSTGAHRFDDVLVFGFAVGMFEVYACFFGDIDEDWVFCGGGVFAKRAYRCEQNEENCLQEKPQVTMLSHS